MRLTADIERLRGLMRDTINLVITEEHLEKHEPEINAILTSFLHKMPRTYNLFLIKDLVLKSEIPLFLDYLSQE
jgi:hypothetical protein